MGQTTGELFPLMSQPKRFVDLPAQGGRHRGVKPKDLAMYLLFPVFPQPQVIFQYFDGLTGELRYAEAVVANGN